MRQLWASLADSGLAMRVGEDVCNVCVLMCPSHFTCAISELDDSAKKTSESVRDGRLQR
jgi:hypothetical protein